MQRNVIHHSLFLILLVAGSLLLLGFLEPFKLGQFQLRKIDLLADIRVQKPDLVVSDSLVTDSVVQVVEEVKSNCPPGLVCFEDYSPDSTGLKAIFEALKQVSENKVRIAVYGDSFVEGDMFCGSLRDTLQHVFGGRGVGMVPITSEVAGFRITVKHKFDHWKTKSLVSRKDTTIRASVGPTGYVFLPQENAFVEYQTSYQRYLREFNEFYLYYKSNTTGVISFDFSDSTRMDHEVTPSGVQEVFKYLKPGLRGVRAQFPPSDSLEIFGASLEGTKGVVLDNFYMRGNSGISLSQIPDNSLKAFQDFRQYKLIILQYGLNVVNDDSLTYRGYANAMIRVIRKLKKSFSNASIVLVGVSDRATNTSGSFKTMASIKGMRDAQRYVAAKTGIVFWDLFEAMGGDGAMVRFAEAKPALAAKDYTHLNFRGGQLISGRFMRSFLYHKKIYETKR